MGFTLSDELRNLLLRALGFADEQIRCGVGHAGQKPAFRFFFSTQARPFHAVRHAAALEATDAGAAYAVAARTLHLVSSCQCRQQYRLIRAGYEGLGLQFQLRLKGW